MTREEELIRSTTRAIAASVREVPPLRLDATADELGSRARTASGGPGGRRGGRAWLAPLAAAALVIVVAVALVLVKAIPNGGPVPGNRATAAAAAVPRYYAAIRQLTGDFNSPTQRNDVVIGDSLTGKTVATVEPPARTAFASITAAADDRTFVIFAVTSPTGDFQTAKGKSALTGGWYAVRLTPGAAEPARLTRLPIKPLAVPDPELGLGSFFDTFGTVLSPSGRELAVPEWTAPPGGLTVQVFSVATGQLLRQWTTHDATVNQNPSLAWIDGGRTLALTSRGSLIQPNSRYVANDVSVREWPAGAASGDLVAVSKVAWHLQSTTYPLTTVENCTEPVVGGPDLISPDGKTFSCTTAGGWGAVDHLSFHTFPLAASTTASATGTIDYQVTYTGNGRWAPAVAWVSQSGDTLVGSLTPLDEPGTPGPRLGVISHGTFTPLPVPASLTRSTVISIAF